MNMYLVQVVSWQPYIGYGSPSPNLPGHIIHDGMSTHALYTRTYSLYTHTLTHMHTYKCQNERTLDINRKPLPAQLAQCHAYC